jgi:hypothetical protein
MWQPIETAPKDGARVLLYGRVQEGFGSRVARWQETERGSVWLVQDTDMAIIHVPEPTHWQPLPEPPAS